MGKGLGIKKHMRGERNQSLAEAIKPSNKADVTPEFAKEAATWVRSANQLINIKEMFFTK